MNIYSELPYKQNYNAKDLTAKLSCTNMSILSSDYTNRQNRLFTDNVNIHNCQMYNEYNDNIEKIKNDESDLLKGYYINKKSCIYKRPNYGLGDWKEQFQYSDIFANDFSSYRLFDYQSKSKSTKEPIKCDYSKVLIEETCSTCPYFLHTETFKNDYYNCVI